VTRLRNSTGGIGTRRSIPFRIYPILRASSTGSKCGSTWYTLCSLVVNTNVSSNTKSRSQYKPGPGLDSSCEVSSMSRACATLVSAGSSPHLPIFEFAPWSFHRRCNSGPVTTGKGETAKVDFKVWVHEHSGDLRAVMQVVNIQCSKAYFQQMQTSRFMPMSYKRGPRLLDRMSPYSNVLRVETPLPPLNHKTAY